MSRIVTKLFARVIKAEEGEERPFKKENVDLELVLTSLEDTLTKCQAAVPGSLDMLSITSELTDMDSLNDDKMAPCKTMVRTLMLHLVKAKHSANLVNEISDSMQNAGLNEDCLAWRLFNSSCSEVGVERMRRARVTGPGLPTSPKKQHDSDYLSELIFAVGGAEEDEDRVHALEDLRAFIDAHPNIDIESHLSGLSAPFRKYILSELKSPFRPPLSSASRSMLSGYASSKGGFGSMRSFTSDDTSRTMSEKLQYLKSKINAAEATAQTAISSGPPSRTLSLLNSQSFESSSAMSLRQKLAAASEKRTTLKEKQPTGRASFESSALGNAAALRARLEIVRRMNS